MCVSACMCGMCTHIHMYVWKVTLREVAMFLCVRVFCTCEVCIHMLPCIGVVVHVHEQAVS